MPEVISEYWEFILLVGGWVIYVLRLEGKLNMLSVKIDIVERQQDRDRDAAEKSRDETHRMLKDVSDKLDRLIERELGK